MAKFMFLLRGGCDSAQEATPEEKQQAMQAYETWFADGTANGWLLDCGDGLQPEGRVVHADKTVTDGPFAESKELVGGYMLVEAANMETAVGLVKAGPLPGPGGTLEVRQLSGHSRE